MKLQFCNRLYNVIFFSMWVDLVKYIDFSRSFKSSSAIFLLFKQPKMIILLLYYSTNSLFILVFHMKSTRGMKGTLQRKFGGHCIFTNFVNSKQTLPHIWVISNFLRLAWCASAPRHTSQPVQSSERTSALLPTLQVADLYSSICVLF